MPGDGSSVGPLRCERQSLPVGHAGVQPELLADAVHREPQADATECGTRSGDLAARFLFVAAKIWRHAGPGVSYSDHYEEKGVFDAHESTAPIYKRAGHEPVMQPP